MAVFAVAAFTPSYWLPLALGTSSTSEVVHLHAAAFFAWIILFAVQSWLIGTGRQLLHRRLGIAVVSWSALTVVVGFYVAAITVARDVELIDGTIGGVTTLIALSQAIMFSLFIGLGVLYVGTPEYHKRFMILAALVAVTPAIARVPIAIFGAGAIQVAPLTFTASTGLLLAVAWRDTRRTGRLHPVMLWGTLTIVAVRLARIPLAMSDTWHSTAKTIAQWAA